ncbi:MAG: hypothetical protein M1838_005450, partial [Thelocarpon superellum]
ARRDRSAAVAAVSLVTIAALLATILLLPTDLALIGNTSSSHLGLRKSWATPQRIEHLMRVLKIVYYALYSLDALLCLLVLPFTYFWCEERGEVGEEGGRQNGTRRCWGAVKYSLSFLLLVVIIFVTGFFLPVPRDLHGDHGDSDYAKKLLADNNSDHALTFALGFLITLGTLLYVVFTGAGMAILPMSFLRPPSVLSLPSDAERSVSALEGNRERQRQLEGRAGRLPNGLSSKERRELDALVREERTLVRRERLAAETVAENTSWMSKTWRKLGAIFRPVSLLFGGLLLVLALIIWCSMLLTGIDKASNSLCKGRCGYILAEINVLNPINWILYKSADVYPVDYVLVAMLILFFFCSSVCGLTSIGIRFVWIRLFRIRKGRTSPQAMLIGTFTLALIVLAINYAMTTIVAPQYATFGSQTFCDFDPPRPGAARDCSKHPEFILTCSDVSTSPAAAEVCLPSVMSTFLNRIAVNYSFFGVFDFFAQFAFLAVFLIAFFMSLVRAPRVNWDEMEEDARSDEEESLLGRRPRSWHDVTGRRSSSDPSSLPLPRNDLDTGGNYGTC